MPRPRGGDWLDDDMHLLSFHHIDTLVSLLTDAERAELGLLDAEAACERYSIAYVSFPIGDRQVPPLTSATVSAIRQITDTLMDGKRVVIHCRMGIGRAAMIAASVLALTGVAPSQAFDAIASARNCPVPDTNEQRAWVEVFLTFSKRHAL